MHMCTHARAKHAQVRDPETGAAKKDEGGNIKTQIVPARTVAAKLEDDRRVIGLHLRPREVEMLQQMIESAKAGVADADMDAFDAEHGFGNDFE